MTTQVRYVGPSGRGWSEIVMCDVARRNALGASMVSTLVDALCKALADGARAAVLRAADGSPAWSAGFAIDELPDDYDESWSHPLRALTDVIAGMPFPVIASVASGAWGGGCEVALRCDVVLATADASFALTPGKLGVAYDRSALEAMRDRLPRHLLSQMLMSAEPVTAMRLFDVGVVSQIYADEADLLAGTAQLAEAMVARAPLTLAHAKAVMQDLQPEVADSRAVAAWGSRDYQEGRAAFGERRPPNFTGE